MCRERRSRPYITVEPADGDGGGAAWRVDTGKGLQYGSMTEYQLGIVSVLTRCRRGGRGMEQPHTVLVRVIAII